MKKTEVLFLFGILFGLIFVISVNLFIKKHQEENTWQSCVYKPYDDCAFDTKTFYQAWQDPEWIVCANRIYEDCNAKFGR